MSESNKFTLTDKSILIIDDQKSFQKLLKGMLLQLGANNISFFETGEAALAKFDKETVDIVFIDYNLGNGRNGKQFLEELKYLGKLSRHCITILVTGESTRSVVLSVLEIEPDDYLIKPFSTGMLKQRLSKLMKKKTLFYPAHQALEDSDFDKAIAVYTQLGNSLPRVKQYCAKHLCQIYLASGEIVLAKKLLESILQKGRPSWALTFLAQSFLQLQEYDCAIRLCDELLGQNRFNIDALDIKAQCLNKLNQGKESLFLIEQSCQIAPFSFARQQKYADIAAQQNSLKSFTQANLNLLQLTKGTAFEDLSYQFNFIRALFHELNNANSKEQKVETSSQIKKALKNAHKDAVKLDTEILFTEFETFCSARLAAASGDYVKAKKTIAPYIAEQQVHDTVLPDSIIALLDIGEYEEANQHLERFKTLEQANTTNINQLLNYHQSAAERQKEFEQHNVKGIEFYKRGDYLKAINEFELALNYAPTNTGSALNLLQALIQLLPKQNQSTDVLREKCENTFALVDGMALPKQHSKRLTDLKREYNKLAA